MTRDLELVLRELGIAQYLDAFIEQGFDSWDTILDIQESDLDVLGVKLGHRRKLQRRIANVRGVAPSASLPSPTRAATEELKQDGTRHDPANTESNAEGTVVAKRKYRRHPKPDENAPDRPPSAYVLFSNKLRESLKGQTLTFTEIAKLVGENWQSLTPSAREKFESQANAAKETYHREMSQYKKTEQYCAYLRYLEEFREKQGKSSQGQENAKRQKVEPARLRHTSSTGSGSTTSGGAGPGAMTPSESAASSEKMRESEPCDYPPNRRHDSTNSVVSIPESRHSSTTPKSMDESAVSDKPSDFDIGITGTTARHNRRPSSFRAHGRREDSMHQHLPSLSDMLDSGHIGLGVTDRGAENPAFRPSGFSPANNRPHVTHMSPTLPPGPIPPNTAPSAPASFRHHDSSPIVTGITGLTSSRRRTIGDGPLAIHSLLIDGSQPVQNYDKLPPSFGSAVSPIDQGKSVFGHSLGHTGYGFQTASSAFHHMKVEKSRNGDVLITAADDNQSTGKKDGSKSGFDGMSALLEAGEIVGRSNQAVNAPQLR